MQSVRQQEKTELRDARQQNADGRHHCHEDLWRRHEHQDDDDEEDVVPELPPGGVPYVRMPTAAPAQTRFGESHETRASVRAT